MQVICPKCGARGEAGGFCEMGCGRLPATPVEVPTVAEPAEVAEVNHEGSPRLSAVLPGFLQQGVVETVVFSYGFDAEVATSVTVRILSGSNVIAEATTNGRLGREGRIPVNLKLEQAGYLALTVIFAYRRGSETEDEELEASLTMEVKPRASSIVINQNQSINISGNYGQDLAGARIGSIDMPKEAFQVERPTFSEHVFELRWRRTANRMLLVAGSRIVQMLAQTVVTLGRDRGNDVVLRYCDAEEGPQNNVSLGISGSHLRLELSADGCAIVDGDGKCPSTRGTFVDGVPLRPQGRKVLRNGSVKIGFGLTTVDFQLELAIPQDRFGKVRGCVLTRTDAAERQTVVLLENGEVPLGAAGDRLAWYGGLFMGLPVCGEPVVLAPGTEVELAGTCWQVMPFQPSYIHHRGCELDSRKTKERIENR